MLGGVAFGFLAGILSTMSPCVLPLLPLVLGPAVATHRLGLPALVAGLTLSFVAVGLFVATIGFAAGLDSDVFRRFGALALGILGVVLLSGGLQQRFAAAAGGVGNAANRLTSRIAMQGPSGQFLLGVLLGAIWSPCVGPTLGAASLLASQQEDLAGVAAIMLAFGVGSALPLVLLGMLSRRALLRWRGRLMDAGRAGKVLLGCATIAVSVLILSGLDRTIETLLVAASPFWLTDLTTRF